MANACFAYGTLISEEIYSRVVYGESELPRTALETFQPAKLAGYARFGVRGQSYPGIIPCEENSVTGILVRGISAEGLKKLDEFESTEYERRIVSVSTSDGTVDAWAYIWLDPAALTSQVWEYDEQVKAGLIQNVVKEFLSD